jgi:hypothetical protein
VPEVGGNGAMKRTLGGVKRRQMLHIGASVELVVETLDRSVGIDTSLSRCESAGAQVHLDDWH